MNNFNFDIYRHNYDDIKKKFFNDKRGAYTHWLKYGNKEGRSCELIIKPEHQEEYNNFDWESYLNNYSDLKKNYSTQKHAWLHWILHGKKQGKQYYNINTKNNIINNQIINEQIVNEQIVNNRDNDLIKYPALFHKYILKIRNLNDIKNIYEIKNNNININKNKNKYWTHLHCFDINRFNEFYLNYINEIEKYFSIIITYHIGDIDKINKNYILLKLDNYGMDIGPKFTIVNYLKKNNIPYEYILFLHSKSDVIRRKIYFEPLINNLDKFIEMANNNICAFLPPLILDGDHRILNGSDKITSNNKSKISSWGKHNSLYMDELIKYHNLNKLNHLFPEGNCYILKKELVDLLFSNDKIYGILNTKESFDYSWVRIFYKMYNNNSNIDNIYKTFKNKKLFGNNLDTKLEKNGLPDCMIEHTFERLVILFAEKLKMNIEIFPINEQNYNNCKLLSNYINTSIQTGIFDGKIILK